MSKFITCLHDNVLVFSYNLLPLQFESCSYLEENIKGPNTCASFHVVGVKNFNLMLSLSLVDIDMYCKLTMYFLCVFKWSILL